MVGFHSAPAPLHRLSGHSLFCSFVKTATASSPIEKPQVSIRSAEVCAGAPHIFMACFLAVSISQICAFRYLGGKRTNTRDAIAIIKPRLVRMLFRWCNNVVCFETSGSQRNFCQTLLLHISGSYLYTQPGPPLLELSERNSRYKHQILYQLCHPQVVL